MSLWAIFFSYKDSDFFNHGDLWGNSFTKKDHLQRVATISIDFQYWRSLRCLDIWENCSWGHLTFQQSSGTPNATNSTLGLVYTEGKLRPYCNAIIYLWVCFLSNLSLKGQRVYLIVDWDDLRWTTSNAQMLFTLKDNTSLDFIWTLFSTSFDRTPLLEEYWLLRNDRRKRCSLRTMLLEGCFSN